MGEADVGPEDLLTGNTLAPKTHEDDGLRNEFGFARAFTRSLLLLLLRWSFAHRQTGRVEFLADAAKAFLSSWLHQVHGVLRVAGVRPLTQQSLERRWCCSMTSNATCLVCASLGKRACLQLHSLLGCWAPCSKGPSLQVDLLITPGSWWTLSALQDAPAVANEQHLAMRLLRLHGFAFKHVRYCRLLWTTVEWGESLGKLVPCWTVHQLRSMVVATGDRVKQDFLHPTVRHCCHDRSIKDFLIFSRLQILPGFCWFTKCLSWFSKSRFPFSCISGIFRSVFCLIY